MSSLVHRLYTSATSLPPKPNSSKLRLQVGLQHLGETYQKKLKRKEGCGGLRPNQNTWTLDSSRICRYGYAYVEVMIMLRLPKITKRPMVCTRIRSLLFVARAIISTQIPKSLFTYFASNKRMKEQLTQRTALETLEFSVQKQKGQGQWLQWLCEKTMT